MQAIVAQVLQTSLNISGLAQACKAMHQPNPAEKPDHLGYKGMKHTIASLDAIQNEPFLTTSVLHLGYMVVSSWEDMPDIIMNTKGMPHVYHDGVTTAACVIIVGSVEQWLNACRTASSSGSQKTVRYVFNRVFSDIQKYMMLNDNRKDFGDGTFLLEDKR